MVLPTNDFCLLAATTDEYALLPPLRDRFKITLPFSFYDVDSLATITRQHAQMSSVSLEAEIPIEIGKRARGTPRVAIRLLESCHRYARSRGDEQVTMAHFERAAALEGIDEIGLASEEQRYLRVLADHQGQPVRLFTLEATLGIHRRTIQAVIEPFLLRSGLIERAQYGRQITIAGLSHLGMATEAEVSIP